MQFQKKSGDRLWGTYKYPVTGSQHQTVESLYALIRSMPAFFCSQHGRTGAVIMGAEHRSVEVKRDGKVYENSSTRKGL